jgi:hypothetical protein
MRWRPWVTYMRGANRGNLTARERQMISAHLAQQARCSTLQVKLYAEVNPEGLFFDEIAAPDKRYYEEVRTYVQTDGYQGEKQP